MKMTNYYVIVITCMCLILSSENSASVVDSLLSLPTTTPVPTVAGVQVWNNTNDGNYEFRTVVDNATEFGGHGQFKEVDGNRVYEVSVYFKYVGSDGKPVFMRYVGDDKGFRIEPINKINRISPKGVAGILG